MKETQIFSWVEFYQKFAKKLLEYREARPELIRKLKNVFAECKKNHPEIPPRKNGEHEEHVFDFPRLEKDESDPNLDIDPFTVFGFFNKGLKPENRSIIIRGILKEFDLDPGLEPIDFDAIPTLHNLQAVFFRRRDGDDKGRNKRGAEDINHLWELFSDALLLAENENEANEKQFAVAFDSVVRNGESSIGKVSMGLFWIAHAKFIALDKKNLSLLYKEGKLSEGIVLKGKYKKVTLADVHGEDYLAICKAVKGMLEVENRFKSGFAEFSYAAEQYAKDQNDQQTKKGKGDAMMENNETTSSTTKHPLNQILFGPPGTGKTYSVIERAVEICDPDFVAGLQNNDAHRREKIKAKFEELKGMDRIALVTFHQSYGYEDFIEGIKPIGLNEDESSDEEEDGDLKYKVDDGRFKKFCVQAISFANMQETLKVHGVASDPQIWKVSLKGTGDNDVRSDCMKNGYIRIGFADGDGEENPEIADLKNGKSVWRAFRDKMRKGDIVLSCYSATEIDAVGVVMDDEPQWGGAKFSVYRHYRRVKWVLRERVNIVEYNQGRMFTLSTIYRSKITPESVIEILQKHNVLKREEGASGRALKRSPYVFIIDEINRGNISKIFGELITLIEPSKRIGEGAVEGLKVELPYSHYKFGVPNNVYIIGTMNTADRSIAMLDTALRRRFEFVEMMPRPDLLNGIKILNAEGKDTGINIVRLLEVMNERIEVLLDREHQIGHAYFLEALKDHPTIDNLGKLFQNKIIPLLQEYFYDDYEKIRLVLGDENSELDFIKKISMNGDVSQKLFKSKEEIVDIIGDEKCVYRVNDDGVYKNPLAYQKIYDGVTLPGEKTN